MAKKGMKRTNDNYSTESNTKSKSKVPKNDVNPVPEVRSKN